MVQKTNSYVDELDKADHVKELAQQQIELDKEERVKQIKIAEEKAKHPVAPTPAPEASVQAAAQTVAKVETDE